MPEPARYHLLATDGGIAADQPGKMAGEAAIGVVLKAPFEEISESIGPAQDHHVAEYRALIRGLEIARSHGIERLRVCLDSALIGQPAEPKMASQGRAPQALV
jgi:ribonuclease HI